MITDYPIYLIFLVLTFVVSIIIGFVSLERRPATGALALAVSMFCIAIWSLMGALMYSQFNFNVRLILANLRYVGIFPIPIAFYILTLRYRKGEIPNIYKTIAILSIVPSISAVFLWTDYKYHLFYRYVGLEDGLLVLDNGLFFWVNFAYTYLLVAFAIYHLVRLYISSPALHRKQVRLLISAAIIPLLANFFYIFDFLPLKYFDVTPIAFCISGLHCYYSLFRYGFLEIVPIARERLIESMDDLIIVLNNHGHIIDMNKRAIDVILNDTAQKAINKYVGLDYQDILSSWPELVKIIESDSEIQTKCVYDEHEEKKYYHIRISGIDKGKGVSAGKIIVMRDITELEMALQAARNSRKALQEKNLLLKETNAILKEQSVTDSLTGVYNHQYIINTLESCIQKSTFCNIPLTLIMLDLDYFKNINDRYGHLVGDRVLVEVSQSIKKSIRINDYIGRYGGEEFLIVLPGTDIEGCRVIAERIRYNLEKMSFAEKDLVVTASLGLAEYKGEDIQELIHKADTNLLKTKKMGRNTIVG